MNKVDAVSYLRENPNILQGEPIEKDLWLSVYNQATRHCHFGKENDLYKIARPSEEQVFTDWRKSNRRDISIGSIERAVNMLTKTLQYASKDIEEISDVLEKSLEKDPFNFFGKFQSFDEFRYSSLLNFFITDPNGFSVEMPFFLDEPFVPEEVERFSPAISADETTRIDSITIVVPSVYIKERGDVTVWYGGEFIVDQETEDHKPYYWVLDNETYYFYKPVKTDEGIIYELVPWYVHKCEKLPITEGLGRTYTDTVDIGGVPKFVTYKRSYFSTAFSYFDEMVIALSTDQANRIRHLSPRLWIKTDIKCMSCGGEGYTVDTPHASLAAQGAKKTKAACKDCRGTGQAQNIGEFSTIIASGTRLLESGISGDPVGYVTPPVQALEASGKIWKEWRAMGEDELCISILEGTPNESSLAKSQRLEPKKEFIKTVGDDFMRMSEDLINNKESILQPDAKQRKFVTFPSPHEYDYKSVALLLEEFKESTLAQRKTKFKKYIESEFRGDDYLINVHLKSVLYAPLLMYDDSEIYNALNSGAYSSQDIIKKDYALDVFKEILADKKNQELSVKEYIELANNILTEWGVLKDEEELALENAPQGGAPPEEGAPQGPAGDPTGAPARAPTEGANKVEDIVTLYVAGKIDIDTAADQIAPLTGHSVDEVKVVLEGGDLPDAEAIPEQAMTPEGDPIDENEGSDFADQVDDLTDQEFDEGLVNDLMALYADGQIDAEELANQVSIETGISVDELMALIGEDEAPSEVTNEGTSEGVVQELDDLTDEEFDVDKVITILAMFSAGEMDAEEAANQIAIELNVDVEDVEDILSDSDELSPEEIVDLFVKGVLDAEEAANMLSEVSDIPKRRAYAVLSRL